MARGTPGKFNSMCTTCFSTQSESYWTKTSDISLYTLSDLGDLKQTDWFAISDYSTIFTSWRVDNV